jgi:hypothetical protein
LKGLGKLGERLHLFAGALASIEAGGASACSCQNGSVSASRGNDAGGCSKCNIETTTSDAFWGVETGLDDERNSSGSRAGLAFSNIFNWGDGDDFGFTKIISKVDYNYTVVLSNTAECIKYLLRAGEDAAGFGFFLFVVVEKTTGLLAGVQSKTTTTTAGWRADGDGSGGGGASGRCSDGAGRCCRGQSDGDCSQEKAAILFLNLIFERRSRKAGTEVAGLFGVSSSIVLWHGRVGSRVRSWVTIAAVASVVGILRISLGVSGDCGGQNQ